MHNEKYIHTILELKPDSHSDKPGIKMHKMKHSHDFGLGAHANHQQQNGLKRNCCSTSVPVDRHYARERPCHIWKKNG